MQKTDALYKPAIQAVEDSAGHRAKMWRDVATSQSMEARRCIRMGAVLRDKGCLIAWQDMLREAEMHMRAATEHERRAGEMTEQTA